MSPIMFDSNENNSSRGRPAVRAVKGHNLYFAPSVSHLDFWWGTSGTTKHNRWKTRLDRHHQPNTFHPFLWLTVTCYGMFARHETHRSVLMRLCSRSWKDPEGRWWNKQVNWAHSDLVCMRFDHSRIIKIELLLISIKYQSEIII